jgi:hypothetical protein
MRNACGADITRLEEEWEECLDLLGECLRSLPESDARLWVALDLLERGRRLRRRVSMPEPERARRLVNAAGMLLFSRRADGIRRYILPDRTEETIRAFHHKALALSHDRSD